MQQNLDFFLYLFYFIAFDHNFSVPGYEIAPFTASRNSLEMNEATLRA